jgi:hypothetical protein
MQRKVHLLICQCIQSNGCTVMAALPAAQPLVQTACRLMCAKDSAQLLLTDV